MKDLMGKKFGRLTVIEKSENHISKTGRSYTMWKCKCDCGNEVIEYSNHLKEGANISCGCLRKENLSKRRKKYNKYEKTVDCVIMYTTKNEPFYIDIDDFDKIKHICWSKNSKGYLGGWNGEEQVLLHRYIMNCPDDLVVDHLDKDVCNNRKSNLQITNGSYNNMNRDCSKYNSSHHIGVYWNKKGKCWVAQIGYNNETIIIGCYHSFDEAAKARENKEIELYGKVYTKTLES